MEPVAPYGKPNFKIQPPVETLGRVRPIAPIGEESVPVFYCLIAVMTILFVLIMTWVLFIEWAGLPLPSFLRIPVAS